MFLLHISTRISYIASHHASIINMNFIGACPTLFFFNNKIATILSSQHTRTWTPKRYIGGAEWFDR